MATVEMPFFTRVGGRILPICQQAGEMLILLGRSIHECRWARSKSQRVFVQMKRTGVDTLPIAAAMSVFTGMVLALHSGYTLRKFDFVQALASIVSLSMVKEMGPVLTALLLAGRIGASISAEIGTMQVNEEIDALHTLGIDPVRYLVMPRFLACVIMLPILVTYASAVGILGGAAVASVYFQIPSAQYFKTVFTSVETRDLSEMLIKPFFFGAIVCIVACQCGFRATGGAAGVGRAITSCVVTSFVCIFVCNYFVTFIMRLMI